MTLFCESERISLRYVDLCDAKLIAKWKDDPLVREMSVGLDTKITVENEEADIKRNIEINHIYLIIVVKETDTPIGYIRLDWLDHDAKFAWLRFGLGCEREKGYAKEALLAVIPTLFKNGLHRIDAEVLEFNKRSFTLLTSIGFKYEGTRRKAYYANNEYSNIFVLGLLKEDL